MQGLSSILSHFCKKVNKFNNKNAQIKNDNKITPNLLSAVKLL